MTLFIFILFLIALLIYQYSLKKFILTRKNKDFRDINNWMNMSLKERNLTDSLDKENTLKRKKNLLKKIRKEYDQIKKIKNTK
tara:strand:+ start:261 stop:509 length:249 start_codon:yes stop_codon:yes gene_type:complete